MKNREAIDSDLKVPASVQEQNRHNIQTSIHRRGEQTLNKQEETDGEKKVFAEIPTQLLIGHIRQKISAVFTRYVT